ncbi:hypothetical protein F511_21858 [Dorcoceras hygrometricum]|uniref:Dystroglycan-like n=1 Tax=Dorcoceras hygrometricum TaxID=472368 RepID=A0A2Z7CZ30_9LAMI|nr:hypothetical protein F511_21858 [Dorcoceras hygrometricum]
MAASFYSNSVHVDFESALAMGEPGMVSMFQALIASGLQGFLGCPAMVYEDALVDFFANGTVRDGLVVSTVNGVTIEISEKLFTETFDLPVDGLSDIFEMPKDKIFDARSIVYLTGEPVTLSGLKSQMKMHYRLLCDIMAKSNFCEGRTIHRYIAVIDKSGAQEPADEPKVKKALKKKVASRKRPVDIPLDVPVVKKKRTSTKKSTLEIVVVAQEAIPIQSVPVSPAIEPMVEDQQAEFSKEQPADELPTDKSAASTEERHWFDLSYEELIAKWAADRPVTSPSDTDEEIEVERPVFESVAAFGSAVEIDKAPCDTSIVEGAESLGVGTAGGVQQVKFSEEKPVEKSVDAFISVDETMSLDDILYSIPEEVSLSSTGVEVTKISFGKEIKIPGVIEFTWHLAGLPKIPADHKGKEPLIEKNPIKGNPVMEQVMLILADIDCLVQVRAKLVDEVAKFFYSFSFKRLANLQIDESYFDKEDLVLTWAEAESTGIALQRRRYILLNYREVLLRKFLEVRKMNFKPSEGSSAIDLKILDQLYDIHLFILEELNKEIQAHGLMWKKTCCSKIFEGRPRDRGAIIARTNSNTPSKCWIRTMLRVNGTWVIEPCADYWMKIPQPDVHYEIFRQRQYDDTLPSPTVFALRLSQFCTVHIQYSLFSRLTTEDFTDFLSSISLERTVLRSVQNSIVSADVPHVQLSLVQGQSSSTSADSSSSLNFDATDLDAPIDESQSGISSRLHKIEQSLCDSLRDQADIFKNLSQGAHQEARTIDDVQTLRFNDFHKNVLAQNASIFTGLADVRKEVQEVNAKVDILASRLNDVQKNVEETKEALSHQLLEFQSQSQANQNILNAQLSELVNYINRGSADKKGESSSRGPQQPDAQISASAERTPSLAQRVEMAQRRIVQTVLVADSNCESLERQAAAERDRERRRREARLLKRRRS